MTVEAPGIGHSRRHTAPDGSGGPRVAPTSPEGLTGRTRPRSPWAAPWWAWLAVAAVLAAIVAGATLTP